MMKTDRLYRDDEEMGIIALDSPFTKQSRASSTTGILRMKRKVVPILLFVVVIMVVMLRLITSALKFESDLRTSKQQESWIKSSLSRIGGSDPFEESTESAEDIGIVTLNFGEGGRHSFKPKKASMQELYNESYKILLSYGKKWGYPIFTCTNRIIQGPSNTERQGLLSKEAMLLSVILKELGKPEGAVRLKWIYFLDADTVLMNHNIPLSIFLPNDSDELGRQQILLASFDQWNTLNSGAFFIRVCEESVQFLSTIISMSATLDTSIWLGSDQALMAMTARMPSFIDKVSIVPSYWFNSDAFHYFVPQAFNGKVKPIYQYGDFMIHFMGGGKYKNGWEEMVVAANNQANLSIAPQLSNTRYLSGKKTITIFWKDWLSQPSYKRNEVVKSCILARKNPGSKTENSLSPI